jgi:hypothetical protein
MAQTIQARDVSLEELRSQFNLQPAPHPDFFSEWQGELSEPSQFEQQQLARLQQNYLNLSGHKNFSEEAVKMVVLSPLLDLAAFYQAPFGLQTEESVELISEDEGLIVRGKIDVLVVQQRLWVLVIEAKSTQFDVLSALPQALTYLLNAPNRDKPAYGLLVNGREFVFVKLMHQPTPTYARSFALSIERDNELAQVLSTLKMIRQKVLATES